YEDDSPAVLLYYTHTSEGYCVTEEDKYALRSTSTDDAAKNVVACGNKIEDILKNKYGVSIINNTTKNDESYNDAYTASEKLLQTQLSEAPTIDVAIDIHRDSTELDGAKYGPSISYNGKDYAPIMFVMGSDCNEANDNWESNVKLAMLIIEKMEEKVPGITKGMSLRKDTYLSEYANKGLLIEIGFSGNYVGEAENTAEVFAEALGEIYG
ncbi:MAG: stage II sporulation protein P, partial [Clostridia bacterium]|nr:stage II sporulation protein P [Clostridia bacterium]